MLNGVENHMKFNYKVTTFIILNILTGLNTHQAFAAQGNTDNQNIESEAARLTYTSRLIDAGRFANSWVNQEAKKIQEANQSSTQRATESKLQKEETEKKVQEIQIQEFIPKVLKDVKKFAVVPNDSKKNSTRLLMLVRNIEKITDEREHALLRELATKLLDDGATVSRRDLSGNKLTALEYVENYPETFQLFKKYESRRKQSKSSKKATVSSQSANTVNSVEQQEIQTLEIIDDADEVQIIEKFNKEKSQHSAKKSSASILANLEKFKPFHGNTRQNRENNSRRLIALVRDIDKIVDKEQHELIFECAKKLLENGATVNLKDQKRPEKFTALEYVKNDPKLFELLSKYAQRKSGKKTNVTKKVKARMPAITTTMMEPDADQVNLLSPQVHQSQNLSSSLINITEQKRVAEFAALSQIEEESKKAKQNNKRKPADESQNNISKRSKTQAAQMHVATLVEENSQNVLATAVSDNTPIQDFNSFIDSSSDDDSKETKEVAEQTTSTNLSVNNTSQDNSFKNLLPLPPLVAPFSQHVDQRSTLIDNSIDNIVFDAADDEVLHSAFAKYLADPRVQNDSQKKFDEQISQTVVSSTDISNSIIVNSQTTQKDVKEISENINLNNNIIASTEAQINFEKFKAIEDRDINSTRLLSLLRILPKIKETQFAQAVDTIQNLLKNRASVNRKDKYGIQKFTAREYIDEYFKSNPEKYKKLKELIDNKRRTINFANFEVTDNRNKNTKRLASLVSSLTYLSEEQFDKALGYFKKLLNGDTSIDVKSDRQKTVRQYITDYFKSSPEKYKELKELIDSKSKSRISIRKSKNGGIINFANFEVTDNRSNNTKRLTSLVRILTDLSEKQFNEALEYIKKILDSANFSINSVDYKGKTTREYVNGYLKSNPEKYKILKEIFNKKIKEKLSKKIDFNKYTISDNPKNNVNRFLSLLRILTRTTEEQYIKALELVENFLKNGASITLKDNHKWNATEYIYDYTEVNPEKYKELKRITLKYHPLAFSKICHQPRKSRIADDTEIQDKEAIDEIDEAFVTEINEALEQDNVSSTESADNANTGIDQNNEIINNSDSMGDATAGNWNLENVLDSITLPQIDTLHLTPMLPAPIDSSNVMTPHQMHQTHEDTKSMFEKRIIDAATFASSTDIGDSKRAKEMNDYSVPSTMVSLAATNIHRSKSVQLEGDISAFIDGKIINIINTATNKIVDKFIGHTSEIYALHKLADGGLISYSMGELRLWYPGRKKVLKIRNFISPIIITATSNGLTIQGTSTDQENRIIIDDSQTIEIKDFQDDIPTARPAHYFKAVGHETNIRIYDYDKVIKELKGDSGKVIKVCPIKGYGNNLISYCPGELKIWHIPSETYFVLKTKNFISLDTFPMTINVVSETKKVYIGGINKDSGHYETEEFSIDGLLNCTLSSNYAAPVLTTIYVTLPNVIAYVDLRVNDKIINIMDQSTNKHLKELGRHNKTIGAMKRYDDRTLISYSDGQIKLWDIHTGENKIVELVMPMKFISIDVTATGMIVLNATIKNSDGQDEAYSQMFEIDDFKRDPTSISNTSNSSSSSSQDQARALAMLSLANSQNRS